MVTWKQGYMIQRFEDGLKIVMTSCHVDEASWKMKPNQNHQLVEIVPNSLLLS